MQETSKKRKSVKLTKDELKALRRYSDNFSSKVECAEEIGIERGPLERVILVGSGSPETIEKIKAAISL